MKTLEDHLSFYAAYHQDARNRATHFIGVPAIVVALMIPLSWVRMDAISAAMLVTATLLAYYVVLDFWLGIAMCVVLAALLAVGEAVAARGAAAGWSCFGALFVGGWMLQLAGHAFEGRKPALADNLFQVFVAPIFLCAEFFFALGYKPKLHAAVQARAAQMRANATDKKLTATPG